ncbi:unnamed protein product [Closterium sp. NIES-54]
MTLCPSSVQQCAALPSPPVSSLPDVLEPESDLARAARATVTRLFATVVTDPSFDYSKVFALVNELVDFAATRGELAFGCVVLEDGQFELECLATISPHFASMLLCPEGDPAALDIPTLRSYAEAIMVDGMWIFRVKRLPGSPPAFKVHYVARGFSQRQGVDFFQTFSPTPKMTTLWVLVHVAAQRDYELHSLDFSTAFLQGKLHEEIWLRRPPGFSGTHKTLRRFLGRRPGNSAVVTGLLFHSEAKIHAGAMAALELHWLTYLLTDLGERPRSPPVLATTSSTAASAASATSAPSATATASSASTAAADTSTPATTPTTTPTPSTATTTTSTAPASPTSALAPLAPDGVASLARGRRSSDRLETTEVGRSSRSNRGQERGGGTPLKDGVYGLRQAPREWHDTLRTTLAALGFAPSTADPSLFLRTDTSLLTFYILVYIDDLVFATADTAGLAHVKSELQKRHTCTDLGELRSYLGLQITRDRAQRTITVTQSHMVQQVLQRFDFTYSSPQATPLSTRHSLSALPSDESVEPSGPYPELVGCLMYLMTCTRPDLAYPLSILARYVAPGRHRPEHMAAAKRVLRYLCSTSGLGLVLGGRRPVVLTGHADASWADDQATQRSSQGYTFSLGSGSWRSTRSSSVLGSSCEAEIYAGAMAAQELRWLTYLLTDLGEPPRSPPVLYVDNKAMLALCREHRLEHRTKHIALRYFLARELQQRGQLRLAYVASQANTADIFTKALPPGDHQRFYTMLGLVPTWPHLLTS